jgi:hypothetical protein
LDPFTAAIFGDSLLVGDCGGRTLSGVFDDESLVRSFATEILDGDGEVAIDELLLVSDFTGDVSLLFGREKLNLSDFCDILSESDLSVSTVSVVSRLYLGVYLDE